MCPACRVEHVQQATRCADCDVELVQPEDLPAEDELVDLPPAGELACVRVAPLQWIRALSDGLEQHGVPHRIETARPEDAPEGRLEGYALFYACEDVDGTCVFLRKDFAIDVARPR